jgi:threonine synthase
MKDMKLFCTNCSKDFEIKGAHFRCDACGEPLELEEIGEGEIREGNPLNQSSLSRYSNFLPFVELDENLSLGEGFTSLVESIELGEKLGLKNIYFKNETENPTWSFKDRGTVVGVMHAIKSGFTKIGTVSTGNMATSVAAYGAKAKLETFIMVNKTIAAEKLKPIAIYNPHLIKVEGDYGNLYFQSLKIGEENGIYFLNSDVPMRVEGYKTISFEICEQLNFDIPDYIVVPTSAGGNIRGIEKGFREFKNAGIIDRVPKFICAQASGCSPITNAFEVGNDTITRVIAPNTIAHAIENPLPPSGNDVLRLLKRNGGTAVGVTDEEIIEAQAILAEEGIFGQPASAVPLAAVKKLRDQNYLKGDERVVCIVTGSGLKYTAALERHDLNTLDCKLEDLSRFIKEHL